MPPFKILVRSTNWIGDAIMTTPALGLLEKAFPDARIYILARPWVHAVFAAHPAVSGLIRLGQGGLMQRFSMAASLRKQKIHMAVLFPNSFDSALLARLAGIPLRAGYSTDGRRFLLNMPVKVPGDKEKRHQVFYYCKLVEELSAKIPEAQDVVTGRKAPELFLRVPDAGVSSARSLLEDSGLLDTGRPLVGLNPGAAYGPAKCWPADKYAALALELERALDCHILVFGTEKEKATGEKICESLGGRAYNLAGKTSLEQVMGLIARLNLLVTNDSGLMHVGAALGTKLVAIFGSTNPVTTGPWSQNALVVRHELSCSPCLKRDCSRDFRCMKEIQVKEVFDACLKIIGGGREIPGAE